MRPFGRCFIVFSPPPLRSDVEWQLFRRNFTCLNMYKIEKHALVYNKFKGLHAIISHSTLNKLNSLPFRSVSECSTLKCNLDITPIQRVWWILKKNVHCPKDTKQNNTLAFYKKVGNNGQSVSHVSVSST